MKIIRLDDCWGRFLPETWQAAMMPPSHGLDHPVLRGILPQLKIHFPHPGKESHQEMPVILQPGKEIGPHSHPEWTIIYFIDAEQTPIIVDGMAIYPANNTAIRIPPNVQHAVAKNKTSGPRLSLALRWIEQWH